MSTPNTNIAWVDIETTGLDAHNDHMMEIAVLVTNADLEPLDEGVHTPIRTARSEQKRMDDYVRTMHTRSGLAQLALQTDVECTDAEQMVITYLQKHYPNSAAVMAGNSITLDRNFIQQKMPDLFAKFSHRSIDVSSIGELGFRWYRQAWDAMPPKKKGHRAMDDIHESIKELSYYYKTMFISTVRHSPPGPLEGKRLRHGRTVANNVYIVPADDIDANGTIAGQLHDPAVSRYMVESTNRQLDSYCKSTMV